jgi:cation:H+ antiporter
MLEYFFPELANTIIDNVILLILGLWILVKGSGIFVQSAGDIARYLGVSEFVIGMTLIAIGTSLPELVSAIIASINDQGSLVLGNIVGANVTNLTLIVGGAAALRAMPVAKAMLERDGYMALLATSLLGVFALNSNISLWEGIVFLTLFVAYTIFLVKTSQTYQEAYHIREFVHYFFRFEFLRSTAKSIHSLLKFDADEKEETSVEKEPFQWKNVVLLIISIVLIVLGGNVLVGEAVSLSSHFELPVTLVGVLLALGTTAPEMSVSFVAARKGMPGMVIGNAIGSVLCNTFLILGVSSIIAPISVSQLALYFAIPFLLLVTIAMLVFKKTGNLINRLEGISLIVLYLIFVVVYALLASYQT